MLNRRTLLAASAAVSPVAAVAPWAVSASSMESVCHAVVSALPTGGA